MCPDFDDDEYSWHPDKEKAFEEAFWRMDAGDAMMVCTYGKEGCPGADDFESCQNCATFEKRAGDTLKDFLARCARSN